MKEFRYTGIHAEELNGGRPIAPGEYTGPISVHKGHNKDLLDAGVLLEVEDGTAEEVRKIDAAAVGEDINPNANLDGEARTNEGEDDDR